MGKKPPGVVDVLPAEEEKILLENARDVVGREGAANCSAMLVEHDAAGLVENLPAALPGHVAEIGVFEIERPQEMVEAAQLEEFRPVKGAGSASPIKAGIQAGDLIVKTVANTQAAVLPPPLGQARFFANFFGIAEEDLTGNGKD